MKLNKKTILIVTTLSVILLIASLAVYWIFQKEGISIVFKGETIKTSSFKNTVEDLLKDENIKYGKNDIIKPSLDTKLDDYMEIKITEVKFAKESEKIKLPFETDILDDKEIIKGTTVVEQEGEEGEKESIYALTYYDGVLVEKELVSDKITKKSVNKLVKRGVKENLIVASRGSSSREHVSQTNNSQEGYLSVVATAYSGGGLTAIGTNARWGVIAVDPKVIPYGTKVYIPQFNMTFIAEDCGGAIKGNKIDIYMNSDNQVYNWGRRTIDIFIK